MRKWMLTAGVLMLSVVLFSCGGDDKESYDTFTPTEANAAATDLNNQNAMDQALESMDDAFDFATPTVLASKVMSQSELQTMKKGENFQYNPSTGWWTFAYTYNSGSFWNANVQMKYRYTPRDGNGHATNTTDKTEYMYDYNVDADTSYNSGGYNISYSMNFKMLSDMVVTGMVAYNGGTGNLHLNGNHEYGYDYRVSAAGQSVKYIYSLKFKYLDVQLAPTGNYPASGTIQFTVKRDFNPEVQQLPNYTVTGTITFDGDNTATLTLGGQTFQLNLDTGDIIVGLAILNSFYKTVPPGGGTVFFWGARKRIL